MENQLGNTFDCAYVSGDENLGILVSLRFLKHLNKIKPIQTDDINKDLVIILEKIHQTKSTQDVIKTLKEILGYSECEIEPHKDLLEQILKHPQYQVNIDLNRIRKILLVHELIENLKMKNFEDENYESDCNKALNLLKDLE